MFEAKIPMEYGLTNEIIGTAVRKQLGRNLGLIEEVDLAQVVELNLFGGNVLEIAELELLPNLEKLTLGGFWIKDLDKLSRLTKLKSLSIHEMPMATLDPLKKLVNLENLVLHGVQSTDFTALKELYGLKTLSLACTEFSDVSLLAGLIHLESLDLSQTVVLTLNGIETLMELRVLKLGGYHFSEKDTQRLNKLSRLENLYAARCNFGESLDQFQSKSLKELILFDSTLGSLGFLAQLPLLEKLTLDKSTFQQQQCFPTVKNLKMLSLGFCKVDGMLLDSIGKIGGLEELALNQSGIRDVKPLTKLFHLKRLSIASNAISGLGEISMLKHLEYLNASNNQLEEVDVHAVGKLSELKYLDLSYNRNISQNSLSEVVSRIVLVSDKIRF